MQNIIESLVISRSSEVLKLIFEKDELIYQQKKKTDTAKKVPASELDDYEKLKGEVLDLLGKQLSK